MRMHSWYAGSGFDTQIYMLSVHGFAIAVCQLYAVIALYPISCSEPSLQLSPG